MRERDSIYGINCAAQSREISVSWRHGPTALQLRIALKNGGRHYTIQLKTKKYPKVVKTEWNSRTEPWADSTESPVDVTRLAVSLMDILSERASSKGSVSRSINLAVKLLIRYLECEPRMPQVFRMCVLCVYGCHVCIVWEEKKKKIHLVSLFNPDNWC